MSIIIFIIKHPYHSGRNVMLDQCLTVLMGEPGRLCVGDRAGLPGLCVFLGNTSVVGRGRGRVGWIFQCSCWSAWSYCYIINAGLKL